MAKLSLGTLFSQPDRLSLEVDAERVLLANTPATESELGKVIFGLLIMYDSFERRPQESKTMVIDQWRKSLSGWPVDVLEEAAQRWINGPKASYMPQPGDVVTACEEVGRYRRAMAKKAADFLDMTHGSK